MGHETKRTLKVFLCHASGDKPQVRALYKRLVSEGVDAWLDQEKLLPGQDWRVEIPNAVKESDVVVICLSNNSITKEGYVQKEIKFALDSAEEKPEGTIFLIPARLEECIVPERLNRWQWVDLFEENGFVRLLRSLKLRADAVGVTIEPTIYEDSDKERGRRLEQLYTEGLAAFYTEDWDKACRRFQSILSEQPNHKNAAEKLAEAERQRSLARLYTQATEAYQTEKWQVAIKTLEELSQKSAAYKDAAQLLGNARKHKQLRELYAEAKALHTAQKWQAVVKVFEQISVIEPNYPDPDGLLTSAQKEVAELKRLDGLNDLYSQGVHKMDAGEWYEARNLLEQVHKAETGFLDTERLLRKVENEILKLEERRKRDAQVQMLYEQARKMTRAGQWGKTLAQMEEIQKLDDQFVDSDGIAEKAKAELEREEQEAQRRRELAALYAEAVSLLEAKKYQEALEKWNAIQAIDPRYKDGLGVKKTARRKLDELSRPEAVARPWSKIMSDWLRLEANVPTEREIFSEKLLLLSFAVVVIIRVLWGVVGVWLNVWESIPPVDLLYSCLLGGLYGAVVAFILNRTISNWRRKHSLALVIGWVLGFGVSSIPSVSWDLPPFGWSMFWYTAFTVAAVIKWARPAISLMSTIIIFVGWALAWKTVNVLGFHLGIFDTDYTWAVVDALTVLLGLLFTFGMQAERSGEVLKTAFWGALGFAVGNYIVGILWLSFPAGISFALWGLIGGAILEAPSRNTRRVLLSAGMCGLGLLIGSFFALDIVPIIADKYTDSTLSAWYTTLHQPFLGAGLGLTLGLLTRRATASGVLALLGAGAYLITRALNQDVFNLSESWENIIRGALIGLVLGYGYGYVRQAKPLEGKTGVSKTKLFWIGIISFVAAVFVIIGFTDPTMYDDFNNPLYNGKFNNVLWAEEIFAGSIVQENGLLTFEVNTSGSRNGLWAQALDKPTYPIFMESKMMLDSASTTDAQIYIAFGWENGEANCGIVAPASGIDTQNVGCGNSLGPSEIQPEPYPVPITPGTWHIIRIELYPDTMTFVHLVDGNEIGLFIPQDPDKLRELTYTPLVFLVSGTDSAPISIGYVDYVRIGKIEE